MGILIKNFNNNCMFAEKACFYFFPVELPWSL